MNRDIFKSIDEKLTPSSKATDELFEKAGKTKAGEKYIGQAEEIFLSKGIIPETDESQSNSLAKIKDNRLAIAAAAAVLALVIGSTAILGTISQGPDKSPATQKTEESKSDSFTHGSVIDIDANSDTPWVEVKALVENAYKEYTENVSDNDNLQKLAGFEQLVSYSDQLNVYIADMIQNGELDGGLLTIAINAADLSCDRREYIALRGAKNAMDYYKALNDDESISTDYYGNDDPESYTVNTENYADLLNSLDLNGDYRNSWQYEELLEGELSGMDYAWLFYNGKIDKKRFEIAFEILKKTASSGALDRHYSYYGGTGTGYWNELTTDPKQYFYTDRDIELWVKLKLDRIQSNALYDKDIATSDESLYADINFLSLKGLGEYTTSRAILSLYENGELSSEKMQFIGHFLPKFNANISKSEGESDDAYFAYRLSLAAKNCARADFVCGQCGGNYRESANVLTNRKALDKLYEALDQLDHYLGEETASESKYLENAYCYIKIYSCRSDSAFGYEPLENTLTVIVPQKDGDTVIVNGIMYTTWDSLMEKIVDAIETAIPPYGKHMDKPEFLGAYIISAGGDINIKANDDSGFIDDVRAFAGVIKDTSVSTIPKEFDFDPSEGIEIELEYSEEKKQETGAYGEQVICIPDIDGESVYIDGREYFPDRELIDDLISYLKSKGVIYESTADEKETQ